MGVGMMADGRINSLRLRIGKADTRKIQEIAKEILEIGPDCPAEILNALTSQINKGAFLTSNLAADLIALFKHRELFEATKASVMKDPLALLKLLRANFPDSAIEKQLCEALLENVSDLPLRKAVVEGLRDHGSRDCLPYLSALSYDFFPKYKTAQVAADPTERPMPAFNSAAIEEHLQHLVLNCDLTFGQLLQDTITRVKQRDSLGFDELVSATSSNANPRIVLAHEYLEDAKRHLNDDHLSSALNKLRMAFESLLKWVIEEHKLSVTKPKPLNELDLGELVSIVRAELFIPKPLARHLDHAMSITTSGSHDQGKRHDEFISRTQVEAQFDTYSFLERFFPTAALLKSKPPEP
jgi:hypothetical protein